MFIKLRSAKSVQHSETYFEQQFFSYFVLNCTALDCGLSRRSRRGAGGGRSLSFEPLQSVQGSEIFS